jgi:alpha-tubulin suppressor-like RCC1 family protein
VYAWGYNRYGQLGLGHTTDASTPQLISALAGKDIARVVGSAYMSAAITGASLSVMLPVSHLGPAEGVLYMWGGNEEGYLGLGDTEDRRTPTVVSSLSGRRVVDVVSSENHTIAVTVDADGVSSVMAWGANDDGQLGLGTMSADLHLVPVEVPSLRGRRVMALEGSSADGFNVALLSLPEADRE